MNPVLLIIIDGWGYSSCCEGNAIYQADTPHLDSFFEQYPWSLLEAAGEAVGLPPGQMGNSEVGHLNIGAGRIVYQELSRISCSIESGEIFHNKALRGAMELALQRDSALHLLGLVSDGGVHSHLDHLLALLEMAGQIGVPRVYIHAILDGRDVLPASACPYLEQLYRRSLRSNNGRVATVSGRYYAMDRDRRWERTALAYRALVRGEGRRASDPLAALEEAYGRGETDEFVLPSVIVDGQGAPLATIGSADSLIFFNFRPDRARQISRALVDEIFTDFDRGGTPPRPHFVSMTEYDRTLPVLVAFPPEYLVGTLGELLSKSGCRQLRLAETEKYAHVTFFFNGGREEPFPGEERILIPSPRVATYDLKPEMSAPEVTAALVQAIETGKTPFIVANYANADMVGHTGSFKATVCAVEAIDRSLGEVARAALARGWWVLISGDHGNAEQLFDESGGRHTAHTLNPVPFLVLGNRPPALRSNGLLADVAPTFLELAGLPRGEEMTGRSLILHREAVKIKR